MADLAAPADEALDALLGATAARRLRRAVVGRARRWAAEAAPGRALEATSLDAARTALHLHGHAGPVLLAAPDVPGLDAALVADARDDFADGVLVTVGSTHDATPYLVGLARVEDELFGIVAHGFEALVAELHERGAALGMLRSERRLAGAADARALAVDPATPPDLAAELAPLARRLRHRPGGA
ncbi:MAG TPA: hypothetical protein VLA98_06300 [Solirubrobacteraceae bacterium]|nr:hypothetical protein [Solirubrobacteraceae bacterium]